jgi:hypothetical protein
MGATLPVPHYSQILAGALAHKNDCGPTSGKMDAGAFSLALEMTVDQVYDAMQPSGDVPIFIGQIQTWLAAQGIQNDLMNLTTIEAVFDLLYQRRPPIALIHYGTLVNAHLTQRSDFLGAHYVVITGMDIESIYIHDPYRTDESGTHQPIPIATFMQAWREASLDQNPQFAAIVPRLPIQDLSKPVPTYRDWVVLQNGIYVRTKASESSPLANPSIIYKGAVLHLVDETPIYNGSAVLDSNKGYVQVATAKTAGGTSLPIAGNWVWKEYLGLKS